MGVNEFWVTLTNSLNLSLNVVCERTVPMFVTGVKKVDDTLLNDPKFIYSTHASDLIHTINH